ncbi:hypothetical protein Poli38472_007299 [Pythium oligandrum]|uniref:Heme haloperoxidase family profile domain-containing protein n=1 Tax=Pythium oligandrum TaxID=41045 RepID=A0A8K1C9F7_PYTOL|nr:hypothetical protein Poli38472_007299 [Pythium oligandrum]|eukprot:TMW59154.1 hypothetical protein Poli38472_007299 [Pythium oligandrum]
MVSVYAFAAAAVALISTTDALQGEVIASSLPKGQYYRPTGDLVSGRPTATTPFRRGPCPAVNTLANHGYIPRDGQNVSKAEIKQAVMTYFNIDEAGADTFVNPLPAVFDINQLSVHNKLEHDGSLVHADSYLGEDPASVNRAMLKDVYSRFTPEGVLGVDQLADLRKDRLATCMAKNPNCTFGATQVFLAYGEAVLVLSGFGDVNEKVVDKDTLQSFLEFERFPENFERPDLFTKASLLITAGEIQALVAAKTTSLE